MIITRTVMTLGAAVVALGLSTGAYAGDVAKETATAQAHAGMAASATAIAMVHAHLHHVVNCLVGPKGTGYDAAQANPCKDQGDGAIPDATDAAAKAKMAMAVSKAQDGIKTDDLAAATKAAGEAAAALK